ncbi:MAG: hydantoinase/carbamoylase family amidase [Cyclobacteriaceae bacterium]|nr:hydantoinase/carbamoylase family amidase [Cyclobacteriaceae bacterium]
MMINSHRLQSRIRRMNEIGQLPGGGNRRLALTNEDKAARDLLRQWFEEEGLEVQVDEVGNMYGFREGRNPGKAVALGSHLDTVSTGGKYDGTYGVLAALEVISVLNENKVVTDCPLVIVNFTNEEGARFAPDMMGSLVVSKPELRDAVWEARDLNDNQVTVKAELARIGYLGTVRCGSVPIESYVELHIEQGPILEKEGTKIGVVEKVQGIYWTEYVLTGQAAHAGTTPIELRRDPGLLASRINVFLREMAMRHPPQLATIGLMEYYPNVINVVPERVRLVTDLRNPFVKGLVESQRQLDEFVLDQALAAGIEVRRTEQVRLSPVDFSQEIVSVLETCAAERGLSTRRMVSGAGHDAQMMAAVAKAAMIFVPSAGGISHNEKEHTSPADLENGANLLLDVALRLARQTS